MNTNTINLELSQPAINCPKHGVHEHMISSTVPGHEGHWCQLCWLESLSQTLPVVQQYRHCCGACSNSNQRDSRLLELHLPIIKIILEYYATLSNNYLTALFRCRFFKETLMKSLFSALALIAATGCASLTEGTTQTISVKTDVPCTASRGEQAATVTPEWSRLTVNKSNEPITIECGGQVHKIESKATKAALTGAMLLDFGVVDMATGAFWAYPDEVDATAQPITAAEAM